MRWHSFSFVLTAGVFLAAPLFAQNERPLSSATEQWAVELGESLAGPPVPIGSAEATAAVAVALRSGKIVVFAPDGKRSAEMQLDMEAGSAPVESGGRIFAADVSGSVYCFTRDGKRVWKYSRNDRFGGGYSYMVAVDLDGDGQPELILTTERGNLYALDHSGRIRFEVHATNFRLSTPAVGDLDGDGIPEIVFADDDGGVYCVNSRGQTLWINHLHHGRFGRSLPLIADADGNGRYEVYVQINTSDIGPGLYALDAATGKVLWRAAAEMQTYNSIVVADLNHDGHNEILFGDKNTRIYALDPAGKKLWDTQVGGRGIFRAPAISALSGDGPASIFQVVRDAGPEGHSLYALDPSGKVLDSIPLKGGGAFAPLLCKFRGQVDVSLLIAGVKGELVCYRPPQRPGHAKILWPGARNDAEFSGFVKSANPASSHLGMNREPQSGPAERKPALRGRNSVTFPGRPANTTVVFRMRDPDGAVHLNFVQPDEQKSEFRAIKTGEYGALEEWMDPATGRILGAKNITYTLDANDSENARQVALFQKQANVLKSTLGAHADLAGYFSAMAGAFPEKKRDNRAYWQALLRYVSRTRPPKDVMAEQISNPWPDFDGASFFEAAPSTSNRLDVSMLGNEYESAALAITNLAPRDVTLRFDVEAFQPEHGAAVPSPHVVQVRSVALILVNSTGRPAEDVLPRLGEGNLARFDAGETRKIWFTFCSRELAAGIYHAKLRIGDLLSRDEPLEIPVNLTVHPVRLPDRHTYRHENWLTLSAIKDADLREKVIEDALAHGTNVFLIPEITISVSKDGELGEADTAPHDALVKRLRGKAMFLVSRSVNMRWPPGFTPDPQTSEAAYAKAVRWYAAHMQSLGVGLKDWAFYLWDEPGLTGDDARFRWWVAQVRRVKAADPEVQVYANPAGGARPDMLKPIAPLIDIWQPDLALLRSNEKGLAPIFREKWYWNYEPPGEQRELNPLGYYRMKPWVAYQLGMTGAGYWVYSWSDYWFYDRKMGPEFGTVYPTASGPVTTKRWEASRDGIEDFELLWMLKQTAQKAGGAQGEQALQLIDEAVRFVTKGQEHVSDISRKLHSYTPDYFQWMAYRDRLITMQERLNRLAP